MTGRSRSERDREAGHVVDTMVEVAKVWFIAAGEKRVGPLTATRVMERVAEGKVPAQARAWREGMEEWLPISAIEELRLAGGTVATLLEGAPLRRPARRVGASAGSDELRLSGEQVAAPVVEPAPASAAPITNRRPRPGPRARAIGGQSMVATNATPSAPYDARWRLERGDVWRGFGMGLEGGRVRIAMASFLLALLVLALGGGVAFVAGLLHPLLAIPVLGLASFAAGIVVSVGRGALAFDARRRLEEQAPPSVGEALGHAWGRAPALVLPPIVLGLLWPLPLVALAVLAVCVKIPYLGPVGTGLLFGVHIALSAIAFLLVLATATSQVFTAHVVVFEDVGTIGALRALVAFTRRALGRVVVWSVLPGLAYGPFAALVLGVVTCVVAVPVAATGAVVAPSVIQAMGASSLDPRSMFGGAEDETLTYDEETGELLSPAAEEEPAPADLELDAAAGDRLAPVATPDPLGAVPGLKLGLVPLFLWVAAALAIGWAALTSVSSALGSILYVGAREGNDALPSRDAFLSRQAAPAAGTV